MRHTKAITLGFACVVVIMLMLVSGCTGDQAETASDESTGTGSAISVTTSLEVTSTSLATTATTMIVPPSRPITPEDIKSLAPSYSAFAPDEIQVVDFETFGDWAAAHVTAEGAETPIVVFTREADGWTVFDIGTGLGPDDLRSEGVPEDVIEWAFPSGL